MAAHTPEDTGTGPPSGGEPPAGPPPFFGTPVGDVQGPPVYPGTAYPSYPPPGTGYNPEPGGLGDTVYASFGARAGGWLIDAVIVWAVSLVISLPLRAAKVATFAIRSGSGGNVRTTHASGLAAVVVVVVVLVYGAAFIGARRGQTPGMMVVGVRAVDRDTGGQIGFWRALGRGAFEYLLAVVLLLPWILDMLFPLWDARSQTLHDKVSRTVVVRASAVPAGGLGPIARR